MLKIKDNVDLKELEKFGFKYDNTNGIGAYSKSKFYEEICKDPIYGEYIESCCDSIFIYEKNRKIIGGHNRQFRTDFDTLFDLIQAGLVEKGKENNGK